MSQVYDTGARKRFIFDFLGPWRVDTALLRSVDANAINRAFLRDDVVEGFGVASIFDDVNRGQDCFTGNFAGIMNTDGTNQYFDNVADQWDNMRRTFFGEGVRDAAICAAEITAGSVVADVGTGTGFLAEAALAAGGRVIGIDSSEGMLNQVRSRFAGRAFEARRGHVDSLPLKTEEADAVLGNMVLHHAPDPAHAILEMARALKAGGRLIITDADTHTHEWLRTEQHDRWLGFDRADIVRWFDDAGLVDLAVVDTNEICSPASKCGDQAAISIFLARGRKPA